MLDIQAVAKSYGQVHALRSVSLKIPAGQMVGVIGRSGAGKSTLLRMINRLADPTAGTIAWSGAAVTALRDLSAVQPRAAP